MAPVINALQSTTWCDCTVIATAQHRQLLDQVFALFNIKIDVDLDIMRDRQTLPRLTARLFEKLDEAIDGKKYDIVLAQGDTTTVFVASMVAFYHKIPFGHVEAGLRTYDIWNPFPEEMNRVLVGRLANVHFAPTDSAALALRKEGVDDDSIVVTGNTVIDALLETASKNVPLPVDGIENRRFLLLTAHRRENFGQPMQNVFRAVTRLLAMYPELQVVYPVHPNPNVQNMAYEMLGGEPRVHLLQPMEYATLVSTLKHATLVLTDSGGIQEEAPALGKPVLVLRDETERPEAIHAGVAKLVGTDEEKIVAETAKLLDNSDLYNSMAKSISPYGDGKASQRIVDYIARRFLESDESGSSAASA